MEPPDPLVGDIPECGIARFLTLLDGPWATLIVRELLTGPLRFTELLAALPGISAHTLTSRLRKFVAHGLATRTAHAEIPPRVVYELTAIGHDLGPVLTAMNTWAVGVPASTFAVRDGEAGPRLGSAAALCGTEPSAGPARRSSSR